MIFQNKMYDIFACSVPILVIGLVSQYVEF